MSRKKSHRFFVLILLLLILLASVYLFLHSSIFNIASISSNGNYKVSSEEVLALAGIDLNQNIFLLNTKLVSRTLTVHPMIKEAQIIRHLPNNIEIKIVERETWALVPFQNIFLCLDDEGVCLDKLTHFSFENYPIITMEQLPERVNLGQALYPQAVKNVKKLWDALLPEYRNKISDFHLQNNNLDIIIYTERGTEIRFGNLDRMEEKLVYFGYIFEQEDTFAQEGTQVLEYIDLRFQGQPVIKTR